ncbi:hypothetical protein ABT324_16395 [Saccharopolyspora sp. NPDC000359]|uniref:hypothetical protein n=1 Tax=Saccharopolyspora sp. NPDC000359 TaxID=3154251 RepID=UPI0033310B85
MTRREHLPEVLPAPPESGTGAQPVPGTPSAARNSVPGRRPVALASGGLAVVLLPVLTLLLGLGAVPGFLLVWSAGWIVLAAAGWLLDQRTPRRWPGWALLAAVPPAVVDLVFGVPVGVALLVVGPVLAWLAQCRCTELALDLAELDVEVAVPVGTGKLRIGRDRAVLAQSTRSGGGHVDHALPLAELALAQPGEVDADDAWWPLPGGTRVRLRRGPAVRLVAGRQQWVLPVEDPRLVAAIARRRATAAWPQRTGPQTVDAWQALRKWAVARTKTFRSGRQAQAYPAFRALLGFAAAVLGSGLLASAVGRGLTDIGVWIVGAVLLVLGGYFVVAWLRVRKRLKFAELQQLPPHSPTWGDLRPDVAPVLGWRPWR